MQRSDKEIKIGQFRVAPSEKQTCLIDFIASRSNTSKKKAKRLLDSRNVYVNKKLTWMARHLLKTNDMVEIAYTTASSIDPIKCIPILFKDDHLIIADKPPGILANGPDSAEELLCKYLQEPSIRAVHRLDKDTSGCLLLARNNAVFEAIVSVFRKKAVNKTYHAIVAGRFFPKRCTITLPLNGQRAVTHVQVLDANSTASHLLVTIETGRTHQIRKHLAHAGTPVLGDRHYGMHAVTHKTMQITRQMLHASTIEFKNPLTGMNIKIKAPLPADFRTSMTAFRLK